MSAKKKNVLINFRLRQKNPKKNITKPSDAIDFDGTITSPRIIFKS